MRPAWGDTALGAGILVLAAVSAYETTLIPSSAYAKVGPTVFPWAVTIMLGTLGAILTAEGLIGGWTQAQAASTFDWPSLGWLVLGLALNVALIERLGFILASTALFTFTARAFGSVRPVHDAAIGFLIALAAYAGFDRVLGYQIGSGLIESLI
jgi:putative tricarboxylic transport membrane protein